MANETTSSTISELYTEIIAEAQFVVNEKSLMKNLVKNYTISGGGKSVEVPIYAQVAAAAVADATDLANTAINPTSVTITASEVGIMTTLTDLARNSASRNVAADIGQLFGNAIAKKIDVDILAKFDGFSVTAGSASTVLAPAGIFNAAATLSAVGLDPSECYAVMHPHVAYDLKSGMTNTFAGLPSDVSNEAMRTGYVGQLAGIKLFETANMSNTGTAGNYKIGIFHRDALAIAMMQDLKLETQRDASLRADEIVATAVYGVGELHDSYGVELHVNSSIVS
jgi:N4-gp56 family major capsid protein